MTSRMNRLNVPVSVDQYLAESHVLIYLSDAVTQLLEHKEEYIQFGVTRYLAEYFSSVKNGNHVLFREFSYIQATPHNRASFLRVFWRCYRQLGKSGDLLSVLELRSLLQLLCPDFPVDMVKSAARIVLMDDALDCLMSFPDFLLAFQLQLFYQEFLDSVLVIYQDLLAGKSPNTVIVPTSSSVEQHPSVVVDENTREEPPEDVDAAMLAQCLETLCERFRHSHPPRSCLTEILEQTEKISYYSLLMSLAKHGAVNQAIGALPCKAGLMVDPEMDQELDKLIAQVSISPSSNSNSSGSVAGVLKEVQRKASPRRNIHHRRRMEVESDGSTEETDSSEN